MSDRDHKDKDNSTHDKRDTAGGLESNRSDQAAHDGRFVAPSAAVGVGAYEADKVAGHHGTHDTHSKLNKPLLIAQELTV